ncbi:MAG: hypothetical protein M0P22_01440 [Methanoculleus sp.]|nr:hypothetical protein [Methanoculleus sp.]MDD3917696.1 hypothetical protein [Synergistaceae bacterium]
MSNGIKILFGAVLGVLYAACGLLQVVQAIFGTMESLEALFIPGNIFSGSVLLVIGTVFLTGVRKLSIGTEEGMPFIYVGILFSVGIGLVELLALCALGADAYLVGEWADWSAADAVNPLLYLAVIGVLGLLAWGKEFFRGARAA